MVRMGGAVLVPGAAVRAPEGASVVTPSCHSARWGAVVVSGAAVQMLENIFVLPLLGLGAPVQWFGSMRPNQTTPSQPLNKYYIRFKRGRFHQRTRHASRAMQDWVLC